MHTLHSNWVGEQTTLKVAVTRVTFRLMSCTALDKTFSGTLPQWLFLQDFQPVTEHKKKPR